MAGAKTTPSRWRLTVIFGSTILLVAAFVLLVAAQMQQGGVRLHNAMKPGSRLPVSAMKPSHAFPSTAAEADARRRAHATSGQGGAPPKVIAGLSTEGGVDSHAKPFKDPAWRMDGNALYDTLDTLNQEGGNRINPQNGTVIDNVQDMYRQNDLEAHKVFDEGQPVLNDQAAVPPFSLGTDEDETEPVYYDLCKECCYRYTTIVQGTIKTLDKALLEERGCQKRLPDAIIFGTKKGGTTTLKSFLSYHPDVAFTQKELKFFTSRTEMEKGLGYYRSEMVYSAPHQVAMEKTPAYSFYKNVPVIIRRALPNIKLIIIMKDPIKRAVSDYIQMQNVVRRMCHAHINDSTQQFIAIPPSCDYKPRYKIADTFQASVLDSSGNVEPDNTFIAKGMYVAQMERYLKYFRRDQILAIDGEAFIHDPYPVMKAVEQFLGIRSYFTRDTFYFDERKGFFCLNKPFPQNCMTRKKGRPHPVVREEVLDKLRDFYRPYNKALEKLVGLDLHWSS